MHRQQHTGCDVAAALLPEKFNAGENSLYMLGAPGHVELSPWQPWIDVGGRVGSGICNVNAPRLSQMLMERLVSPPISAP